MQIKRVRYKEVEKFPEFNFKKEFKSDFFGASPAPFIGRFGYPHVNIGILSPQFLGEVSVYDDPWRWSKENFSIHQIAGMRYEMVNSRQKADIYTPQKGGRNKLLEITQEVGMASKPVEMEVNLEEKPKLIMVEEEGEVIPFGPAGAVKKIKITSNVKVDSRVERVVGDKDLKATGGVWELYKKGFEENFLMKLISVGNLGLKQNRKLVPTRFAITAVDSTIGNQLAQEVKSHNVGDYQLYFGGNWGNYYLIMFFSEIWAYELFEMYLNYKINPWSKEGMFYSTDFEPYEGRKNYADECAGGFYSVRMTILEKMNQLKRQHSGLALRFITSDYNIPLGVWVTREASRKALDEKPITFVTKELMISYAKSLIERKFSLNINQLLENSILIKNLQQQKKLTQFL